MKTPKSLGLLTLLPLAATSGALAADVPDVLPEIIVTAEFRETGLLEQSNSTTVLTSDVIQTRAAQHLEEVLNIAPNVNFSGGTSRARFFQVRGIGERSQFTEPLNPSVGLLIDDVDFSGIGTIGTLFDVAQVEVLRGPQGTLHGANALAGLINIRTEAPTDTPYHRVEATAGDYDSYGLGAVSSGPLTDSLRYRLSANQYVSDGFIDNDFLDADDTNDRDELTVRGRLRWLASDTHTLDINAAYIDVDNGYDTFSLDNTRTTLSDEPGSDIQESASLGLRLTSSYDLFDVVTLLSYADTDTEYSFDVDWSFVGIHPDGYAWFDRNLRDRESISGEIRLLSNESTRLFGGRTDWAAGLYYLGDEEDYTREYTPLEVPFTSDFEADTWAVFAQLDTSLTERLRLVTGLRWENRAIDYSDNNAIRFDPDDDLWGGKVALEYDVGDLSMVYASVSRGYSAYGVNPAILGSLEVSDDPDVIASLERLADYDEETLYNYEVGLKGRALDDRLQVGLALFYMDREDQQVRGSIVIPLENGATDFIDYTDNAAEGENYGAELELQFAASERLLLWSNLGWLETEFTEFINSEGEDLSGRDQPHAPNYQYALGGRFAITGALSLQVDVEGKDDFLFSSRHDVEAESYDLLNARLAWDNGTWALVLWGRNLTDEDYTIRGFGGFGNDPRKGYIVEPYTQFGEPRMVGVTGSYTF